PDCASSPPPASPPWQPAQEIPRAGRMFSPIRIESGADSAPSNSARPRSTGSSSAADAVENHASAARQGRNRPRTLPLPAGFIDLRGRGPGARLSRIGACEREQPLGKHRIGLEPRHHLLAGIPDENDELVLLDRPPIPGPEARQQRNDLGGTPGQPQPAFV